MSDESADELEGVSPENRATIARYMRLSRAMRGVYGELLALHLLIEATAEDCIKAMLPNPQAILSKDLSFTNKISLLESLFDSRPRSKIIFSAIRSINAARNQISHGADKIKTDVAIEKICTIASADLDLNEFDNDPLEKRLLATSIKVCGYLLGMVEGVTGKKPDSWIGVED